MDNKNSNKSNTFNKSNNSKEGENKNDYQKESKNYKRQERYGRKDRLNNRSTNKIDSPSDRGYRFGQGQISANDPAWYYLSQLSGAAVGSIPFNIFAGEELNLDPASGITDRSTKTIPGIFVMPYASMPGKSNSAASAVNIMSKAVYSFVRHQNSGHSNYEASDLTLYILAMDEIYTRYEEAKRIYQIALTYDYVNRNIPDLLLKALRVDPDNIRANLAALRYGLNVLAAKISSLAVPANFNLFKRHAIISSVILMDSSSMRGQFYVWAQNLTHKYNPEHEGGGALEAVAIQGFRSGENLRTYQDILDEIENLLAPVISDEDMNIMSGDILKAYGKENLFVLAEVSEVETAHFIYDENMLAQVENSSAEEPYFDADHPGNMDITQSNNLIVSNPSFRQTGILGRRIFNSHKDTPDWKDTLEWTRGMTMNGNFGTEIVMWYEIHTREYNSDHTATDTTLFLTTHEGIAASNSVWRKMALLAAFDWHPIIYLFTKSGDNFTHYETFYGDIKKMTILSTDEVKRLHDSAVMGELNGKLLTSSN